MAWPSSRYKTAAAGGSWTHDDMNGVQDQYVRTAGVETDDLETEVTQALGLNTTASGHGGAAVRRGKSIIATEEARTDTAYGLLTTPDQVENVVMPTDGLIVVAYQALWKESVTGAARAAIFVGADQLKIAHNTATPATQAAARPSTAYANLHTWGGGLASIDPAADTSQVTTGQVVGFHSQTPETSVNVEIDGSEVDGPLFGAGPCYIFAAAGTYDISVQFKASSGSVTAKERKLWVWTVGF
jgi:hypothetical protein